MDRSRRRRAPLAAALALLLAGAVTIIALWGTGSGTNPVPGVGRPAQRPQLPKAVVALGDSTMSGDGAGRYGAGTDGRGGDWCHRSSRAEIDRVTPPGVVKHINLACSGAQAADVGFSEQRHYTETSQAARLTAVAKRYQVVAVVVAVGANDDPQFANTLTGCVSGWLRNKSCTAGFDRQWKARVSRMQPKVAAAIGDIRTAMHRASYRDSDYELVLQSYAAPLGPDVAAGLQNLDGCPLRTDDLRWIRHTGVRVLDRGLREVASNAGVRYLGLARAGIGHEACSGGKHVSKEWFTRLAVNWQDLTHNKRATHALQTSFHPNAHGYRQFGHCLAQFLGTDFRAAACLPGPDGDLHPSRIAKAP